MDAVLAGILAVPFDLSVNIWDCEGFGREVPLSQRAFDALTEWRRRADVDQPRVFLMAPGSLEQAWYRLLVRAEVSELRFHDLRHEGVSRLFERGLNVLEVSTSAVALSENPVGWDFGRIPLPFLKTAEKSATPQAATDVPEERGAMMGGVERLSRRSCRSSVGSSRDLTSAN